MIEKVTMTEPVFIPVDPDTGEPTRWGDLGEANISVFGDFWRCRRAPEGRGKRIMALAVEDLQELLGGGGAWGEVTHVVYHPGADAYQLSRERRSRSLAPKIPASGRETKRKGVSLTV